MQQLGDDYKFPPQSATNEGVVAVGGDLNPLRILEAYKMIFLGLMTMII